MIRCDRQTLTLLLLSMLAVALTGCATGTKPLRSNELVSVVPSSQLPPPDTTSPTGAYTGVPDYRIGPLDEIEVSVFQVDDLSRTVRVNSTGDISLPMIGVVRAGGKTVQELEQAIAAKLRESVMQDPQVSVFIKEYASQRVTIEGSVTQPGVKALTGRTSLLQLIAMSGGLTRMANPEQIIVFRTIDGQRMAALFNLVDIRSGLAEDPQIFGDDIVVVDDSRFRTLAETMRNWLGFRPLGM
jgi:polysaccharide export outer membrane protein